MIVYPAFVAAVAEHGAEELAARSGVPLAEIRALVAGRGWVAALDSLSRLARALDADPAVLFRAVSATRRELLDPYPLMPPDDLYVHDPETLRVVDAPRR